MFQHRILIVNVFILLLAGFGQAQPITANVIGAKVGPKAIVGGEYRSGYEWDDEQPAVDGRFTDRIDVFGNVADGIQARAFLNRVVPSEGDSKLTSLFIEPAFQLTEAGERGFDSALLTGVAFNLRDEGAHLARVIYTIQFAPEKWRLRHNSIIATQFGDDSNDALIYQTRFRFTYQVLERVFAGAELFGQIADLKDPKSIGDEFMRAGLVVEGKLVEKVGFQIGFLSGITDGAPDSAAKLWLNTAF